MNHIVIKGHLTRDPELKTTATGKEVVRFSVAVNRRFDRDKADFFDCQAWDKTAVFVSTYFRKGQEVLVGGEMQRRVWDGEDGRKRVNWELQADNVEFCGKKEAAPGVSGAGTTPIGDVDGFVPVEDADLPF